MKTTVFEVVTEGKKYKQIVPSGCPVKGWFEVLDEPPICCRVDVLEGNVAGEDWTVCRYFTAEDSGCRYPGYVADVEPRP